MRYGVGLPFNACPLVSPEGLAEVDLPERPTLQQVQEALGIPLGLAYRLLRRHGGEIVLTLNGVEVLILVAQAGVVAHVKTPPASKQ